MQIKNIQLVMAERAIEALIALKLPLKVKTNYKLAQISLAIRSQSSIIRNTREQLILKYGEKGEINENSPNYKQFMAEWLEVANITSEISTEKISLTELDVEGASNISIDIFRALDQFIVT